MDKIQELIELIRNIEISQIVNIIIAIVTAIVFLLIGPFICYGILKIFYRNYEKEEIKNLSVFLYCKQNIEFK